MQFFFMNLIDAGRQAVCRAAKLASSSKSALLLHLFRRSKWRSLSRSSRGSRGSNSVGAELFRVGVGRILAVTVQCDGGVDCKITHVRGLQDSTTMFSRARCRLEVLESGPGNG
jgi:hypothetical protein